MVDLSTLPLVMPLAAWIWEGSEASPEVCVSEIPFLSSECFSQLVAKALGVLIILGSCVNKVPLIMNMMNSKSAAGISRNSLYGEALVYACGVLYGFLFQYPFSSYGENASLLVQNFILIGMAWDLSSTPIKLQEKALAIGGFGSFSIYVLYFLPGDFRYLLMSATWPVMLYARGSQILETHRVKHTGNLSIVTTSMSLVGATIRIGTTMQETGDLVILAGYLLSFGLSLIMFIQYFLYMKQTKKLFEEAKAKKKE